MVSFHASEDVPEAATAESLIASENGKILDLVTAGIARVCAIVAY